jgi:hypothetical protein
MDWATVFVETFSCMASPRRGCDLKAKLGGVFSDDTFVVGGFSVRGTPPVLSTYF